jgi:16S rRNA (guanine527-N7)-methyltransferase
MPWKKSKGSDQRQHLRLENRRLLVSGAAQLGVSLDSRALERFERLLHELTTWNQKINLTGLREERSIVVRHFLDSLSLVGHLPGDGSVLDIGSGAGFPGIPLKIARPCLQITLLEASRKKTYFHRHLIRSLNLSGIRTVWGRSDQEEARRILGNRFDVVVSRALSSLEAFLRDAIHFVQAEGMVIAMRGRDVEIPVRLDSLALMLVRTASVDLPFDRVRRNLLFFKTLTVEP